MHTIIANQKGSRTIEVSDSHLQTIAKYQLFSHLVGSSGIVDESVLDKLKLNVRALLEAEGGKDKDLLDLALDVVYHQNMKAIGLENLIKLFKEERGKWKEESGERNEEREQPDASEVAETAGETSPQKPNDTPAE